MVGRLLEIQDRGHYFSFIMTDGSGTAGFILLKDDRLSFIDKIGIEEGRYLRLGVRIRTSQEHNLLYEISLVNTLDDTNEITLHFAELIASHASGE